MKNRSGLSTLIMVWILVITVPIFGFSQQTSRAPAIMVDAPTVTITTATADTTPTPSTGAHSAVVQFKFGTVVGTYTTCTVQAKTTIDGSNFLNLSTAASVTVTTGTTNTWTITAKGPTSGNTSSPSTTTADGFGQATKYTFACSGAYGTSAPVTVSTIYSPDVIASAATAAGTVAISQTGTENQVQCTNCGGGTSDTDDGTIAGGQTIGLMGGLTQVYDGSNWKRFTIGPAGTASAQAITVQGIASMTPILATLSGTNNINNISGTVSLPTSAATSTKQSDGSQKSQIVDGSGNVIGATSNALDVNIKSGSSSVPTDTDDASIAVSQTVGLVAGETMVYDGTVWRRLTVAAAGSGASTGVLTVQGNASGTPIPTTTASATVPAMNMNSATANGGVNAAIAVTYDDATPGSLTENNFGFVRGSANRNLYTTIRDAAGNERGVNVDANGGIPMTIEAAQTLGTVTTVTTLTGTTTLTPGTGAANLGKAEDAVAASGDTGVAILGVIQASLTAPAADGDYTVPKLNANGATWTQNVFQTAADVAEGSAITNAPVPIACIYRTSFTTLTAGTAGYPICDVNSRLVTVGLGTAGTAAGGVFTVQGVASMTPVLVNPGTATNFGIYVEDAAETAGGNLMMAGTVRRDTQASSAGTTGDNATLNTDANGLLWTRRVDPCSAIAATPYPINIVTATTTVVQAASASNKFYACSIFLFGSTADNVALVEDATGSCASPDAGMMGGTTSGTGINLAANQGFTLGNGSGTVAKTASTNVNVCLITSSTSQLSGVIMGVLAP